MLACSYSLRSLLVWTKYIFPCVPSHNLNQNVIVIGEMLCYDLRWNWDKFIYHMHINRHKYGIIMIQD